MGYLVLPKLLYFVSTVASCSAPSFFFLMYTARFDLSTKQLGLLGAFPPFVSFVAGPLWAALADRLRWHKAIFLLSTVVSTGMWVAVFVLLSGTPPPKVMAVGTAASLSQNLSTFLPPPV